MSNGREKEGNSFRHKLELLHRWNALLVGLLALSGLMLYSGYWREVLGGEARAWIKWLHIILGGGSIVPVLSYSRLVSKHWKQLEGKFWQHLNIILVPLLLVSWFFSGVVLWQFR